MEGRPGPIACALHLLTDHDEEVSPAVAIQVFKYSPESIVAARSCLERTRTASPRPCLLPAPNNGSETHDACRKTVLWSSKLPSLHS